MRTRLDFSLECALERREKVHFEGMDCAEEIGVHWVVMLVFTWIRCDAPAAVVRRWNAHT